MSAFLSYDWPGNVRELEHAIEGSLALAKDNIIDLEDIPATVRGVTAATYFFKARTSQPIVEPGQDPEALPYRRDSGARGNSDSENTWPNSIKDDLRAAERSAIERALSEGGSVSQAANLLGIPRQTLQYRMKILSIPSPRKKRAP